MTCRNASSSELRQEFHQDLDYFFMTLGRILHGSARKAEAH